MTDDFYFGALLGMILVLVLWMYSSRLRARYFVQCAKRCSPVHLEGQFFYIVPAGDYVVSSLNIPRRRQSDRTPTSKGPRNGR